MGIVFNNTEQSWRDFNFMLRLESLSYSTLLINRGCREAQLVSWSSWIAHCIAGPRISLHCSIAIRVDKVLHGRVFCKIQHSDEIRSAIHVASWHLVAASPNLVGVQEVAQDAAFDILVASSRIWGLTLSWSSVWNVCFNSFLISQLILGWFTVLCGL